MFYKHTFLAREGPLGTVWLAAHLQHKLKKSHYTSTHIPSTVERIMRPEVPIALRMSGHLLLGVVRIYSKKVDYLLHDYNSLWVSLRNAFRPVDVNLQENASQAQFNAVTLPETYQLDAFDIDLTMSLDDSAPYNQLRSQEEITLTANIPSPELKVRSTPAPEKSSDVTVNITPPESTVRSIPPPEKPLSPRRQTLPPEQIQQRRRKKRQFFDESLVLMNQFLKNALNDPSDLVKKRKKLPCSALEMWRFRNSRKTEQIFSEPLISGFCAELQSVSNKDMISVKAQLLLSENIKPEARVAESPPRINNDTMECERLRSPDHDTGHKLSHEFRPSPQITPQRCLQNKQTSSYPSIDSESDHGTSTTSVGPRLETPVSNSEKQIDGSNAALSGTELRGSAELDDLSFLEQANNTPPDSQGPLGSNLMSVRTKTMEQYLINHSPLSKCLGSPPEELSLKSILEGRSRKLCMRMFYEIVVLKSHKVIDVKQDEPYGDITLKLTGKASTLN
ncbi:hypothetical protein Cgig2_010655 [Carnegiea gigantea]|uniref:Sister chromatid cohesion 1 protein 3 n=1 Tax=Carnegiea gigantea TaxID=171969 RepID=A0A9Q1GS98_9CARY|nr:hypothetical protein Cgig2_010655 [Carnegiea gigantea]